jgi:hypothetical protein
MLEIAPALMDTASDAAPSPVPRASCGGTTERSTLLVKSLPVALALIALLSTVVETAESVPEAVEAVVALAIVAFTVPVFIGAALTTA